MSRYSVNLEIAKMMKWVIRTYVNSRGETNLGQLEKSLRYAWYEMIDDGDIILEE